MDERHSRFAARRSGRVPSPRVSAFRRSAFTRDGRNLVIVGNAPERPRRAYLCDLTTGQIRPLTADGVLGMLNDGVTLIAKRKFYPFAGGPPKPIPSLHPDERISRFGGKYVWTSTDDTIFRIDLATGQRETITSYGSGRPKQSLFTGPLLLSVDGRTYAYTYGTVTSDLYVVEGER